MKKSQLDAIRYNLKETTHFSENPDMLLKFLKQLPIDQKSDLLGHLDYLKSFVGTSIQMHRDFQDTLPTMELNGEFYHYLGHLMYHKTFYITAILRTGKYDVTKVGDMIHLEDFEVEGLTLFEEADNEV